MEANEMQEFSKQLQESNESEGEGREPLTRISLAISILAVLVAMVTVLGHRSHTEAVLQQERASDQWNQYQAKKIRSYEVAGIADLLALQPSSDGGKVAEKLKQYAEQQKKWAEDTEKISDQAKDFEKEVEHAERQASRYDLGEALLQIAVVLCSITLFTRRRAYFVLGLSIGVVGLVFAASALFVAR